MKKYLCVHGHFYQPPRENPWTDEIDIQETAAPFHDWNARINAECYSQLAQLGVYERISYNFGPTLLSWMEKKASHTYEAVLQADKDSQHHFDGHGSAMAQCFNHMIMPLADERDKHTQVIWGIKDFEWRFKRQPKGMWLPETAVDLATLEVLAYHGMTFVILAPRQAAKVRKIGEANWQDVSKLASIETKRAYLCRLPSGRSIAAFFYDGYMSHQIGFGNYLDDPEYFIRGIEQEIDRPFDEPSIIHCAVDGETYGHHHKGGDKVLRKTLDWALEKENLELTNYAQFLERHPPQYEVQIIENTAWSCETALNRWCRDDHHSYDPASSRVFKWRQPLREALNWLRGQLDTIYEVEMRKYLSEDPWKIRNDYIRVILDPSEENVNTIIDHRKPLPEKIKILNLLQMQKF